MLILKKYAKLQDNITNWDVLREDYHKVMKEHGTFPEDDFPEGWIEFVTLNERPEIPEGKFLCHHYELRDNILYRTYFLVDSKEDTRLYTVKDYEDAVQKYLDDTVKTKGYDNVYTCLSYKGDPDPIFSAEADAVLNWRSQVWRTAQGILNQWQQGQIEQPTVSEVISQLPTLTWPDAAPSSRKVKSSRKRSASKSHAV